MRLGPYILGMIVFSMVAPLSFADSRAFPTEFDELFDRRRIEIELPTEEGITSIDVILPDTTAGWENGSQNVIYKRSMYLRGANFEDSNENTNVLLLEYFNESKIFQSEEVVKTFSYGNNENPFQPWRRPSYSMLYFKGSNPPIRIGSIYLRIPSEKLKRTIIIEGKTPDSVTARLE